MVLLHRLSLIIIAVATVCAWRMGWRWCWEHGVRQAAAGWALACAACSAALVCSVHIIAFASLLTGWGLVTPESVAAVYVALLTIVYIQVVRRRSNAGIETPPPRFVMPRLGLLWLPVVVVLATYAVFLVDALTRFPMGVDGLFYHLPIAARWIQQQGLNIVLDHGPLSHPENGVVAPYLLLAAKLERLVPIVFLPKAGMLALVVYALTRTLGGGRRGAVIAVCIALSIPVVTFQAFSSYIDLYGAVAWLSALLALTWATRVRKPADRAGLVVLAGLSAGVALGSKMTYLVLVCLLGLVVLALDRLGLDDWLGRAARKQRFRMAVLFALAVGVCSSYWFVRGAVQARNPLYPMAVRIGNTEILPGFNLNLLYPERSLTTKLGRWWDYFWREPKYTGCGYRYGTGSGLGAAYAAFVPVAFIAAWIGLVRRRLRRRADRWMFVHLGLATAGGVLVLTAFHEMLRFVLPLVLVAVPVAGRAMGRLYRRHPMSVAALLTVSCAITGAIAALLPAAAFAGRIRDGRFDRSWYYQIPTYIEQIEPGSRIVNLGADYMNHALIGSHLDNIVVDRRLWQLLVPAEAMSAGALLENDVDYIVVRPPWPTDWPEDLPVELVYDDSRSRKLDTTRPTRIYRVDRSAARHATRSIGAPRIPSGGL